MEQPSLPPLTIWLPLLRETLAQEGALRWPIRGHSMVPTLRPGSEVEIVPPPTTIPLGALVVFVGADQDTLVVHRLVRRRGAQWITQGDGRWLPDPAIAPQQVVGVVRQAWQEGAPYWPSKFTPWLAMLWLFRYHGLRLGRVGWRLGCRLKRWWSNST